MHAVPCVRVSGHRETLVESGTPDQGRVRVVLNNFRWVMMPHMLNLVNPQCYRIVLESFRCIRSQETALESHRGMLQSPPKTRGAVNSIRQQAVYWTDRSPVTFLVSMRLKLHNLLATPIRLVDLMSL